MVTKKELLKNVRNYSPQEIADAIRTGVVSLYDLSKETEGAFTPLLKRQVKSILESPVSSTQVDVIESPSSSIGATSNPMDNPSIPVATPSLTVPVPEQPIPVVLLNEATVENEGQEESESLQTQDIIPSSREKPAMFSRVFSFNGRIRRLEYGLTYLAYFVWNLPFRVMSQEQISEVYAIIYLVTLLPFLWILLAQGAKRCHDRGNSGWYQIIPFYFLWMIFAEGESDSNEYGECPK